MAPDRALRVVLYIRVSALMGRGGDDFHSPEVQTSAIRRKTVGMQEVGVIDCDIDQTGTTFAREGIDQIKELAEARAFDVLAVYNVARLGRNTLESLKFLNWLADRGITIISAKQQIDTSTPSGRKALTDLLSGAQMQSEEIGDGWADVIEERAHNGDHHGHRLTGYLKVNKQFVVDPLKGPAMTEAFEQYGNDVSTIEIIHYLAGVFGYRVHRQHLKRWLRNPAYRGKVVLHGEVLPGNHPALVDDATWLRVQDRLAREAGTPPRSREAAWACAGLLFCPGGCPLRRHPYNHHTTGERVYRVACQYTKNRVGGDACEGIGEPYLEPIEAEVLRQVQERIKLLRTDVGARAAELERHATARVDADALERKLVRVRGAMGRLTTAWSLQEVEDDLYRQSMAEHRLTESLAAKELASVKAVVDMPTAFEAATAAEALLELWPRMTVLERNSNLKRIFTRAVVRRRAYWREPERFRVEITKWIHG